jgi:hypothetical protein
MPVEHIHLVLFHQKLYTLVVFQDYLVFPAYHLREINLQIFQIDSVSFESVGSIMVMLGGVEQRFGRNTAYIKAGTSQYRVTFDDGRSEAQLGATDSGYIPTGA